MGQKLKEFIAYDKAYLKINQRVTFFDPNQKQSLF
jgi:hypothetical protein